MLCCAKNYHEKRNVLLQIVFNAATWWYCLLSLLRVHLECKFKALNNNNKFGARSAPTAFASLP